MELKGKVIELKPVITGESKNGEWKRQDIIIETAGNYPKKVCVARWGKLIDSVNLKVGQNLELFIDIESREYQDKWFTNVKTYQINVLEQQEQVPNAPIEELEDLSLDEEDDDTLPF